MVSISYGDDEVVRRCGGRIGVDRRLLRQVVIDAGKAHPVDQVGTLCGWDTEPVKRNTNQNQQALTIAQRCKTYLVVAERAVLFAQVAIPGSEPRANAPSLGAGSVGKRLVTQRIVILESLPAMTSRPSDTSTRPGIVRAIDQIPRAVTERVSPAGNANMPRLCPLALIRPLVCAQAE